MTETSTARAERYVTSLRPAMFREAERIAAEHISRGEYVDDCRAILRELDRQACRLAN